MAWQLSSRGCRIATAMICTLLSVKALQARQSSCGCFHAVPSLLRRKTPNAIFPFMLQQCEAPRCAPYRCVNHPSSRYHSVSLTSVNG